MSEIDSVSLIDGNLYYKLKGDEFNNPIIKKIGNSNIQYNKEILNKIFTMIKDGKFPNIKKYTEEIIEYYTNIDIQIDLEKRKKIEEALKNLISQASKQYVKMDLLFMGMAGIYYIYVHQIIVPIEKRRQKLGTDYMNNVIDLARKYNIYVGLDISTSLGTSKYILRKFYKQFGFKTCNKVGIDTEVYLIPQ